MEKVKLTREQAEAVAIRKNMNMFEESIICHIKGQFQGDENKVLAELSLDEFIRALYIGYEVEETYKVGDWVVLDDGQIVEIIEDGSFTVVVAWIINGQMYKDQINESLIKRHATKQDKWWAKHGREVNEIKIRDVLKDKRNGDVVEVVGKAKLNSLRVSTGDYINKTDVLYNYKIVCFAEDRKDVK